MADAPSREETAAALSRKLEAVFGAIERERMRDVPILNSRLSVAAIGMRPCAGGWLCVLITPWFINAILLPESAADAEAWSNLPSGAKISHELPSGIFEFICGAEAALGPYRMCSLFSPVLQFDNQEAAIAAAEAAIIAFFDGAVSAAANGDKPQVSRRSLLFGRKPPVEERP